MVYGEHLTGENADQTLKEEQGVLECVICVRRGYVCNHPIAVEESTNRTITGRKLRKVEAKYGRAVGVKCCDGERAVGRRTAHRIRDCCIGNARCLIFAYRA